MTAARVTVAHKPEPRAVAGRDPRSWLASCSACDWTSRHYTREWARTYAARHRETHGGDQ